MANEKQNLINILDKCLGEHFAKEVQNCEEGWPAPFLLLSTPSVVPGTHSLLGGQRERFQEQKPATFIKVGLYHNDLYDKSAIHIKFQLSH